MKNSNVVAESGEAYVKRHHAVRMATKYGPRGFILVVTAPQARR